MNTQIQTAMTAAKAYYEAQLALEEAKKTLMPFAKLQADITKRLATEMRLINNYNYRFLKRYDWIELDVGDYYHGSSEIPVIIVSFWEHGRGGDPDSKAGSFNLSEHILNDEPEKFEQELRTILNDQSAQKQKQEAEKKQREIEFLRKNLERLELEQKESSMMGLK